MIITIKGKVRHKGLDFIVVEAGGIGYQVWLNTSTIEQVKMDGQVELWTHEHLREDARDLYGFREPAELKLFQQLLEVSGVGPKMALGLLDLGSVQEVELLIEKGDVDLLSRVPRVGKKTAQKIVLELRGKLVEPKTESNENAEVVTALINMGYNREAARAAVAAVTEEEKSVEGRLRAALRELGK